MLIITKENPLISKWSAAFAIMAATGLSDCQIPAEAAGKATYRAFVADFLNGKITVIDAITGKIIANFGVEGPARLKANPETGLIFAIQGEQGRVDVIEGGVRVISHGDHADISVGAPRMTRAAFLGAKPSHVNFDGTRVAAFFDGQGQASVYEQKSLGGGNLKANVVQTSSPHHGLAAPLGEYLATSIPHRSDAKQLPIGVDLTNKAGKSIARSEDCPRLHGEARSGNVTAFGCADGVLILKMTRTGGTFEKVAYPASLPPDRMVRNMSGGKLVNSFFGDFGPDGMVVIDPSAKSFTFVQLPSRRLHFARDVVNGDYGYAITEEGTAHKINALTGKIEASLVVTGQYSLEGGSAVARPRITASGDRLVVTDPAKAVIHIVDTTKMILVHKIDVPGAPFDAVILGATGEQH
jgi:hypothetical protein